ncbi:hypothetical protein [Afifella sp. YEN Y35]|uniref:hypothetical protein n=1 Tax=Afifella sp. YEN Y35 TaxID=3388337 RepID=UPI0039E1927F
MSDPHRNLRLVMGPADDVDEEIIKRKIIWEEFKWEMFEVSARLQGVVDFLEESSNNPVLHSGIASKIGCLLSELRHSAIRAAEDMERMVREFPRHYPTKESINSVNLAWAQNMQNERGDKIYYKLEELKREIRNYLSADELFGL